MLSTQKNTIDKNVRNHPALRSKIFTIHPGGWIDQTIGFLNTEIEHKNMGSGTIITRLTELLFVEILRRYVSQIPESDRGWLAGLKDPKVGMALQLLHNQPGKKWNVSQLAQAVGVSRSALAKRFHDIIGESPIKYLTEWRMQLAKNLLQTKELSLIEIAEQVGYESEIAFNRAFKRCTGTPPACWRDRVLNDSIGK